MTTSEHPTLEEMRAAWDPLCQAMGWKRAMHFDRGAPLLASRWLYWLADGAAYARREGAEEKAPEEFAALLRFLDRYLERAK